MLTKLSLGGFLRSSEVYNINLRSLFYVITWLLIFIIPSLFKYNNNYILFYIYLILFICYIIIIIIIMYKINKNEKNKKKVHYYYQKISTLNMSFIIKYIYIFSYKINKLFDIHSKTEIGSKIAPLFSSLLLIFSTLNCIILFLLISYFHKQSLWNLCKNYNENKFNNTNNYNKIHNEECLLRKTQFFALSCWVSMCLVISLSLIFEETIQCQRKKDAQKMMVLSTFSTTRIVGKNNTIKEVLINKLVKKIDKSVKLLIFDKLKCKSLLLSHIIYFIICFGVIFGYYLLSYYKYFKLSSSIIKCIDIYGKCISLFCIMILLYTLHRLYVQYKYPLIIMQELSSPINCTSTIDLFAWWKLRRFYSRYEIYTFSLIYDPIVAGILLITIISVAYFVFLSLILFQDSFKFSPDEYVLFIFISYLIIYILIICEIAAATYRMQLNHHEMLTHEIICAKYNYQNKIDIDLCQQIQNHVINYSKPIIILGLNMNETTIRILRCYFVSAIVFIFFNSFEIDLSLYQ